MVDFAKADFGTDPTPLTVTVKPVVSGSKQIQLQLQPLPAFKITYAPNGSGWEKFNASVLQHVATSVIGIVTPFLQSTIQSAAQKELNENASFTVPDIPLQLEGVQIKLVPSGLNISTADADHVLVTASVDIA